MKPILVNNNTEWLRLAPVLEEQGYVWSHGKKPTEFYPLLDTKKPFLLIISGKYLRFKVIFNEETQSVDEYLSTNAKSETVEAVNCCGRCIDGLDECVLEFKEPDYEALYEAQTRAIEEALAEIEARAIKLSKGGTLYEEDKAKGLDEAKEILTNKLK